MIAPALRPYQTDALAGLRQAWREGLSRLVLVAPTGAGKSVLAHELVRGATAKGKRVAFLVHRVQLVQQFSDRLASAGIDHGILRGMDTRGVWKPVVVGSIQTAARRGLPDVDVIIVDEAHAVPGSKDYIAVIVANQGKPILGLTATPWARGMSRPMPELGGALFQGTVEAASYSELIAHGHLVDCDVYAPSEPDMTGVKSTRNSFGELDWSDGDSARAMDKLTGDVVQHWHRLAAGTQTVVFASTIDHSKKLVDEFKASGVRAEHLDAYTSHEDRQSTLRRLHSGDTTLVSCVSLLAEGFDEPALRTMVLARPTRSLIRYVQMVGRVLRPYPGKDLALVIDHSGTSARLLHPTLDRDYTLNDGSERKNTGSDDEPAPIKPCPKCKFQPRKAWRVCPRCGFEKQIEPRQVEVVAGTLEKVARATQTDKQDFYSQLIGYAQEKGKSDSWVAANYRAKFGVWMRGLRDAPSAPTTEMRNWVTSRAIAWAKRKEKERASAAQ